MGHKDNELILVQNGFEVISRSARHMLRCSLKVWNIEMQKSDSRMLEDYFTSCKVSIRQC